MRSWRRHPGAFFENMLAEPPLPAQDHAAWCWPTTSPWTPAPAASTPPPASARTTTRPASRYGMDMVVPVDDQGRHTDYAGKYAGMTTEESNPVILADMKESRRPVRQRGDRPQLSPLLALQEPHHLPGHPPVVLLRGLLQGRGRAPPATTCAGCPAGARTG